VNIYECILFEERKKKKANERHLMIKKCLLLLR
jgi:hypothetical protein